MKPLPRAKKKTNQAREAASEGLCMISCAFDLEQIADRLVLAGCTAHAVSVRELARRARLVAGELEALAAHG